MVALAAQIGAAPEACAYVFASNVQLNGTTTNLTTDPGESVTISYLLNQPADAGVTVALVSGANVVWTTNLFTTGTNQGVNSVVWDGNDMFGNPVSHGLWQVRVQASASGFTNWTRVRIKSNGGTSAGDGYVWGPQGIAVNNNTNSPYFGRVFVGNAEATFGAAPGDMVGIAKYNADGSDAAEGAYSTGTFVGGALPGKIEVGLDDRVYVVDSTSDCRVLSFDQMISTNPAPLQVLTLGNLAGGASYSGLSVAGSGSNRRIYLSDVNGTTGVRVWNMPSGTVNPADTGTTAIVSGPAFDLNIAPRDVALDSSNKLYAIQSITGFNSWPRALGYPAYQGVPLTNATWVHSTFGMLQAAGTAAALHTNYLAVVCEVDNGDAITLFSQTDGTPVDGDGLNNFNEFSHSYTDVAWDRAGNLYVTDYDDGSWRVFSPPGANSFTTTSLQTIKIGDLAPTLIGSSWKTNQFQLQLAGEPGVQYAIESSTNLVSWSAVVTNTAQAGLNLWTIPSAAPKAFFRARVVP